MTKADVLQHPRAGDKTADLDALFVNFVGARVGYETDQQNDDDFEKNSHRPTRFGRLSRPRR